MKQVENGGVLTMVKTVQLLMVYTHHLCAACGSDHIRCNGSSQGHAKYQCKACAHQARSVPAAAERAARYAQVEKLLVERNFQRSVVRATGVSRMSVAKLAKKAQLRTWEVLELNEMWTFLGRRKRKVWLWCGTGCERDKRDSSRIPHLRLPLNELGAGSPNGKPWAKKQQPRPGSNLSLTPLVTFGVASKRRISPLEVIERQETILNFTNYLDKSVDISLLKPRVTSIFACLHAYPSSSMGWHSFLPYAA